MYNNNFEINKDSIPLDVLSVLKKNLMKNLI